MCVLLSSRMRENSISRREILLTIAAISSELPLLAIDTRENAPRFKARTLTGELFTNESTRGKVLLVQFWATWCPYCKRDQPALDTLLADFRGQGLEILEVDVAESRRKVKQFLDDHPRNTKIVMMEDTNLAAAFAARSFPHYVLIDRDGKVVGEQKGSGGEGSLRKLLRKAGLSSPDASEESGELESSPRR